MIAKFWKWMVEKGYCRSSCPSKGIETIYNEEYNSSARPTKQMLIGYMEEYLAEKGHGIGNDSTLFQRMNNGELFSDIRHDQLMNEIERLDE